mmetsp:Transcript_13078/g.19552  ORF Transcript_13078/g.19552 Transcript_13078/m.19552 type:complete len:218 (-) Transcript_13078:8-661(-)
MATISSSIFLIFSSSFALIAFSNDSLSISPFENLEMISLTLFSEFVSFSLLSTFLLIFGVVSSNLIVFAEVFVSSVLFSSVLGISFFGKFLSFVKFSSFGKSASFDKLSTSGKILFFGANLVSDFEFKEILGLSNFAFFSSLSFATISSSFEERSGQIFNLSDGERSNLLLACFEWMEDVRFGDGIFHAPAPNSTKFAMKISRIIMCFMLIQAMQAS